MENLMQTTEVTESDKKDELEMMSLEEEGNPTKKSNFGDKWSRWYENYQSEKRNNFKNRLKNGKMQVFTLLVFIIGAFIITALLIGNGAYVYNDATYGKIENYMIDFVKSNRAEEELKVLEEKIKGLNKDAGDVSYNCKTDGARKLIASTRNGFFYAKVTIKWVEPQESTYVPVPKRNFDNRNEYNIWFYIAFGVCSIGGGTVCWLIFNGILDFVPFCIARCYTICQKFKSKKQSNCAIRNLKKDRKRRKTV